jgi:hypothetical protein
MANLRTLDLRIASAPTTSHALTNLRHLKKWWWEGQLINMNKCDYRHIDLVGTAAKAEKLTKQPSYRAHHIFHDDLIAVERYHTSVKMDKPINQVLPCSTSANC